MANLSSIVGPEGLQPKLISGSNIKTINSTSILGSGNVIAGAQGTNGNQVFTINDQTVTDSYTIPAGKNAGTFGPVTIDNGVIVTVPDGSIWTVT